MTKGKGRLRSVTLREAQQFAGQAEEYLQTSFDALGDGRLYAETGNAVHAGINAADAILGSRTGARAGVRITNRRFRCWRACRWMDGPQRTRSGGLCH